MNTADAPAALDSQRIIALAVEKIREGTAPLKAAGGGGGGAYVDIACIYQIHYVSVNGTLMAQDQIISRI